MEQPTSENIEYIIENQAFSLRYNLAPPPRLTPLLRQQDVFLTQSFCVSPFELTDRRGRGGRGGAKWYDGEKALHPL